MIELGKDGGLDISSYADFSASAAYGDTNNIASDKVKQPTSAKNTSSDTTLQAESNASK